MNEPSTLLALGDFCQYLIDVFIPTNAATLANVFSICLLTGDEYLKVGTIKALQLFVPRLFKQCKSMDMEDEVMACFDETFERCTNLTADDNERVAECAHEFVLDLTRRGYRASQSESRLMRGMYPSFKQVDLEDDGMRSTLEDLNKILGKTEELLQQYPDHQNIDAKLHRLLHKKPQDGGGARDEVSAPDKRGSKRLPPKRMSQIQAQPQRYQRPAAQRIVIDDEDEGDDDEEEKEKGKGGKPMSLQREQPSFIQKVNSPMEHGARMKLNAQKPVAFEPRNSILPPRSENGDDEHPRAMVDSPRKGAGAGSRPFGAKHRDLLSTVSTVAIGDGVAPQVMSMGSYRKLHNERNITVEKLEDVVDKQLKLPKHGINEDEAEDDINAAKGHKYAQFGSQAEAMAIAEV